MSAEIDFDGLIDSFRCQQDQYLFAVAKGLGSEKRLRSHAVDRLEEACSALLHNRYCVAVNSGTDALFIGLRSLGVGPGSEVIVPAFSFAATATAVLLTGATPVFVDVCPADLSLDFDQADKLITQRTQAVVVVHLYGRCNEPCALLEFARLHKLAIVEDAAQAWGSSSASGIAAGTIGQIAAFSFDVSKVVPGIGCGGMLVTDAKEIAETARSLRCHGFAPDCSDIRMLGINSQMSSANAEVLLWKLEMAPRWHARRVEIAREYQIALGDLSPHLIPIGDVSQPGCNYHKFVIRTMERDRLATNLRNVGVPTKVHYPKALPQYEVFRKPPTPPASTPVAEEASRQVLSLPIHPYLDSSAIEYIIGSIRDFYGMR